MNLAFVPDTLQKVLFACLLGLYCLRSHWTVRSGGVQLNCCGLYGRGRSAVLLCSGGGGLFTKRLPSMFPAHARLLYFGDPAFSISMFCRSFGSTVNFARPIEFVAWAE